jgi:asparagine synthase (glutamine-hydrolysing)
MCGICGFIRFDGPLAEEDQDVIRKMNSKLVHRGPDAQRVYMDEHLAFGFCRLSIIGLENGMQPIFNEDRSVFVICNGEIFNYIELREELKKKGHVFCSDSDVEVILHLYEDRGEKLLDALNGQFAFALYDRKKRQLLCARDQMGIIPFFYTYTGNTFIFGSEIKAILAHPMVRREVDMVGLDQVFTFAGLISPRTMFKNIHSLENGYFLLVNETGEMRKTEYWDLIYPEGEVHMNGHTEDYYVDKLEELFEESIRLRLRSDVPYGFYLSGGLDSSAIAMKVSRLCPGQAKELFSIDFVDSEISETPYQILIGKESASHLNRKTFLFEDISNRLRQSIYHCECPLKETYNTASLALSESVRARGIKVILSGEGADELFAGYVGYRFDKLRAMGVVSSSCDPKEAELRNHIWGDEGFFYEKNYSEFEVVRRGLYSETMSASFNEFNCLNHPVINKSRLSNRSILNKRSYVDYKLRLVDHLVSDHGDRMALANSVEVRYPFLDKHLVEFSTSVPSDLKLSELTEKYVVKKMASRFVPKAVVEREKFGFVAPGSPYLIKKKIDYIDDILSYDLIKRQGYFNPEAVERLKEKYSQKDFVINYPFESDLLITIITFGILLKDLFNE